MAKTKATFEKYRREKLKRDKRLQKIENKKYKVKDEQINIENMTPEEFIHHYEESQNQETN